jgi:adenylate kinase family enzyme
MRGLPGAGKSTRAQQLAAEAEALGATAAIHSTDSYFTDPETGVYRWGIVFSVASGLW